MLVNNIIAMFGNGMQSSRPGGGTYQWLNAIRGFGTSPGINVNRLKSCLIWREWGEGYSPRVMIDGYWTGNE